jgi:monoamine oxidase
VEITASNKIALRFHGSQRPRDDIAKREYDHVILALPKSALQDIERASREAFQPEPQIRELLNSAFAFPMVKTFLVVAHRWWEEENRANRYATRVPTRELHYWKGHTKDSRQGLIMAYTDRPASSFWANYVPPGPQIDAHQPYGKPLPEPTERRLKRKLVQYINENNVPDITPSDICWYGIRDWGRDPYGGANHAWRPERKYWVVMRRLAEIADADSSQPRIHVCGEAFSDYHGFIEGALRSAVYVLHRILDRKSSGSFEPLPWLLEENGVAAATRSLTVDREYLGALRQWVANLDEIERGASFQ